MKTDLLHISHLSFQYKGAKEAALTDVSLSAQRGQILGLLGPNGAGKTTLISHLSANLSIQSGDILIDGEPFAKVYRNTPTRISVAPQEYAFYPMLTVLENLKCFAAACDLSSHLQQNRVQACLDFAQLNHFSDTRAQNLSGGLKRRLNLAIAVLSQPDLYLFDEPTVGVDPQSRAFILDAIKHLASQGAAIIYTSHYMEEIEAIADRVAILDRGRILCCDTLSNLLQQGAMTVRFQVKDASFFTPAHASYAALLAYGSLQADGTHHILSLRPQTPLSQVFTTLDNSKLAIQDIQVGRATLEHVFMTLTDRKLRDD
ncbi:MAG TPA: ABC transporter ATP-binding protein [Burkholderiaceae bacterium]|nr:ABC transporter ATP-binding protein [Burkholderiaceae bacterium]